MHDKDALAFLQQLHNAFHGSLFEPDIRNMLLGIQTVALPSAGALHRF